MHGCSQGFTLLVNAEVDSMGGVVDCDAGFDAKSSPYNAAIAKAQEELRLEYDVREERRRELEFLEKGGNPLEYKFGRATSISLQSTSLRDQIADHYVASEAKGSFALAASPHGDSIESSGRPAGSMGREPNIADNLLLFSGDNGSPGREKIARRTGKRSNAASAEQSAKIDGGRIAKELNDLSIFHLGPRGQAYARRNRSKSSRDSHSYKFPLLLPSQVAKDKQQASNEQLDTEGDGLLATGAEKEELQVTDVNTYKNLKNIDYNLTLFKKVAKSSAMQSSDLIGKESTSFADRLSTPRALDNIKGSSHGDKNKRYSSADVDAMNVHEDNIAGKENICNNISSMVGINVDIDPPSTSTACLHESADYIDPGDYAVAPVTSGISNSVENGQNLSSVYIASNNFDNLTQDTKNVQFCDKNGEQIVDRSISNFEIRSNKKSSVSRDDNHSNKGDIVMLASGDRSHEPSSAILSKKFCSSSSEFQNNNHMQLAKTVHEDAILKEARIIEAKIKRASALSTKCISSDKLRKCHWHFVLEEMAWLANDFMQERVWKTAAAGQVCHWIASFGRSKFHQANLAQKQRMIARNLAKAVMNFWRSVAVNLSKLEASSEMEEDCDANMFKGNLSTFKDQSVEACGRLLNPGIHNYAHRLLQHFTDLSNDPILAEAPKTPDSIKDTDSFGVIWDDKKLEVPRSGLLKESLLYIVLPGAMYSYRDLIESQYAHAKEQESEFSMCDSVAGGALGVAFVEEEGETRADISLGSFEGNYSSKFIYKKRKIYQQKLHSSRYSVGSDLSNDPCAEGKSATRSLIVMGKRPSGIRNNSVVPTKRTRTAARQRIISSFGTGHAGSLLGTSKTDVSSGDTSFQEEESYRHGCSQPHKNYEVDSTLDFERYLPFDRSYMAMKPKKKKKLKQKHLGYQISSNFPDSKVLIIPGSASSYEQRLQVDYMAQQEQRDHVKKRNEGLQFEYNGNPGFYGHTTVKKIRVLKRAESPEALTPVGGSMPSPVASQMSNMPNSNKLIRIINNRDRGRKNKALKMSGGLPGSGIAWSTFEDQALVVLVHDMGLNWELVSDALNSTLHFKCIYKKPIDCKVRHKFLMDKSAGDGADSAEDSGSSQPYPSTLPGIPKGSARQLFQRLQGPLEEDTMKSHFEKIFLVGQRFPSCRAQDNKQLLKQITPAHSSHVLALSQACPNNLSGPILSPVDLADAASSNPDATSLEYHASHTNGIVIPSHQSGHQDSLTPSLPTSSSNSMLQETTTIALGSVLSTPSIPIHPSLKDAHRFGVPRSAALPIDDQKRIQQISQKNSGKQQPSIHLASTLAAGIDRSGIRMLPSGNGMGMICGVNRSMSLPRTGFQGVSPSGMLNMASPNNMFSGNGAGMSNSMAHSSTVSGPGNSMLRTRDALQMLMPGQSTEEHRKMLIQEIQQQVSQGNAQVIAPFNGLSAPVPQPVQSVPAQQHQPHQISQQSHILGNPNNSLIHGPNQSNSQQPAYILFAKESQLQQRIAPHAQHSYPGSSAMPSLQNNSQFQQQNQSSSPVNSVASSQPPLKQQPIPRNPQSSSIISNQIIKQKQRQQAQQSQQQQPRNLSQQKQQVKILKGLGRGTMLIQQNIPLDATHVGMRPTGCLNTQASEKLLMQPSRQGFNSTSFNSTSLGSSTNAQQPSIPQKLYSRTHLLQSKQVPPMTSYPDCNQTSAQVRTAQQTVPSTPPATQHHQQRQANQSPSIQRVILPHNRHLSHDCRIQSVNEPAQVNEITSPQPLSKALDSSSLLGPISSGSPWKPETSFGTGTAGEKAHMLPNPQENIFENDAMMPPSTQGLVQRQLSGMQGHTLGNQWQQQQQLQSAALPQPQHRQGVQGNLYTRPSNTGPC